MNTRETESRRGTKNRYFMGSRDLPGSGMANYDSAALTD